MLKRLQTTVATVQVLVAPALTKIRALTRSALVTTRRWLDALWRMLAPLRRFLARERTRKTLKTGGLAVLGAILFLGLAFFVFRNALLRSVLDGKIRSYEKRNPGASIAVNTARFRGLAGVELEGIRLRSGNIALDLGRCSVTTSFWNMLLGRVRLKSLTLSDLRLSWERALAAVSPAISSVPAGQADEKNTAKKTPPAGLAADYGARVARLLEIYFTRIPDSLVIDRLFLHTALGEVRQALYIPRLAIGGPAFATTLDVYNEGRKWSCDLAGGVEREKRRFDLRLQPRHDSGPAILPFLERQWGLKVDFNSLAVALQSHGRKSGVLRLDGSLAIAGLALNHPRVAASDVRLDNAALDFSLRVGPDTIELAPPSRVSFNRMAFQPYVKIMARPTRQLTLKIPETRFAADDLFTSLPEGLFTRLAGIRTSGELAFHLGFAIDLSQPQELEFNAGLEKSGFRIHRFGNADFRAFAEPFLYTAYERDRPVRSFMVGPENPSFRFLERIPSFLKYSVMISEDGAFFSHRGFLLEPFKNSIVANLRAGRFVRGASTISMQLVKNLYLRRHKTIARKLEELLITWLIEENRLVSKERMLETYLNIIEWGPGIYGAQEAARFYFDKDVEELTLAEAIFMAAIIPRPKRFMGFFDDEQRLRPWLQRYYADVSRKMLARGWISQFDFDTLLPEVTLTGPARLLLKGAEAVPPEPPDMELPELPVED